MMGDRFNEQLMTVVPPDVDPAFVERLRALPLPAVRRSGFGQEWLRYLLPLPVVAALAGFALGVLAHPAPIPSSQTIDLAVLASGSADRVVVELMEDILWPYDSPVTLVSY